MSKETHSKKTKIKNLLTKKNIFIGIIAILLIVQYIQIQSAFGTFSFLQGRDSSLITEIGQLKDTYTQVGNDLNEVREFLRLPTKSYGDIDEAINTDNESDKNKNSVQIALFKYVDFLSTTKAMEQKVAKTKALFDTIGKSQTFQTLLKTQNLSLSKVNEDDSGYSFSILGPAAENLIFYYLSKDDGKLFVKTVKEKNEVSYADVSAFEKAATELINSDKEELLKSINALKSAREKIETAINAKETKDAIKKLAIVLEPTYIDKDLKYTYSIFNKSGELIGEIILDTKDLGISLVDKSDDSLSQEVTDIGSAIVPFISKLNTKTLIEKKADKALAELKNTLSDDGFKLLMQQAGLKISEEPRVDNQRIYYDISTADGTVVLSSIVVEKATGVINIVDPKGTNSQNILFFDPDFKKKTLEIPDEIPDYGETSFDGDDDFNILIAGNHSTLVDTMIFAHIDEKKGEIRMISIPRDLFYNGRKINAFPHYYGMPELKKILSDITGYELDKYILIDMYAFIEVIDLIGGIDIHLNSAVIDPTYRTVDNGKVGTLHYKPGDYHLGGKEALRLARSRHTSSDFARAERQQMIIEAIQDKAKNFGFGDADTIYEIAKTVLSKTESDISIDEAIAYYFRYQNYKIMSNDVMSSGNVLYVPPYITVEDCASLISAAEAAGQSKPGCESENHGYTLLPLNNNWNIIKWFFKENFEGVE